MEAAALCGGLLAGGWLAGRNGHRRQHKGWRSECSSGDIGRRPPWSMVWRALAYMETRLLVCMANVQCAMALGCTLSIYLHALASMHAQVAHPCCRPELYPTGATYTQVSCHTVGMSCACHSYFCL